MNIAATILGSSNIRYICRKKTLLTQYQHLFIYLFTINIRGLLEKYPTFGREKETGLLGALDT